MKKSAGFKILLSVLSLLSVYCYSQAPDTAAIKKQIVSAYDSSRTGNCNFTRAVARKLMPVCSKINNDNLLAGCYRLLAHCYEKETANDSSIFYYEKALYLYKRAGNQIMTGKMLVGLGIVHYNIGDYDKAIHEYFDAIKVYEPAGDTSGMAWTYNNIGNIYFFQKGYDDALKHYLKAQQLFLSKNNKDGLGVAYGNIALIYQEKKDTTNAIAFYKKALQINRERNTEDAMANNLCNLASLYLKLGKDIEAEKLYNEALVINEKIKNYYGLSLTYVGLAALADSRKDYAGAERYLNKSLEANKYAQDRQSEIMTLANLAQLYYERGRYKDAYRMLLRCKQLSDSINTGDKLAEVEARFGKEKREKEIKLLKQANEINELEIERKQTTIYASFIVGLLVLIIAVFFVRNFLQKKRANQLLQEKNSEILEQKTIIEHKQKEVMDSIQYAKKIQSTLIENRELLKSSFENSLVFFLPKDIVSGDFYFTASHENRIYLAVCDSTGHGVPGAFMSLLNTSFLNEAINEKQIKEPHQILNYARNRLISSVSKDGSQDGMDCILFCFEYDKERHINYVTYSAANNRPLLISNGSLEELPADKMPVGKGLKNESFSLNTVKPKKGDILYLYTDGFADQFGGPHGKKFKYKQLNELLLSISTLPFNEQNEELKRAFETWKGNLEQIDDVCLVAVKL